MKTRNVSKRVDRGMGIADDTHTRRMARHHETPALLFPDGAARFQHGAERAEQLLKEIADHSYTQSGLKPFSKTLFFISRAMLALQNSSRGALASPQALTQAYARKTKGLRAPLDDDYDFSAVIRECGSSWTRIVGWLEELSAYSTELDVLGAAFDALLRGKFESGEGLGTYLTPEEIVFAMTGMVCSSLDANALATGLVGDICGGTGRFVYALSKRLLAKRIPVADRVKLFDQSRMAVSLARINFILSGHDPEFAAVDDSLTNDDVGSLRGKFAALATNPPFGSGKYPWSSAVARSLGDKTLAACGLRKSGDVADPAELFLYRNLDLLRPGGCLGIVLPDGIVCSATLVNSLREYEQRNAVGISVRAVVSLPASAFALGGTVAKTSFIIVTKTRSVLDEPLYVAAANNIGFVRRGDRRVPDPAGNQLHAIAEGYDRKTDGAGTFVQNWRHAERLSANGLLTLHHCAATDGPPLSSLATGIRESARVKKTQDSFHISILDIDDTGMIDVVAASRNAPVGDILISCINPRIWRCAVVPDVFGNCTCSPEFLVVRPNVGIDPWELWLSLCHPSFSKVIVGTGTSSSRQRVEKARVMTVRVPKLRFAHGAVAELRAYRCGFYARRLNEVASIGRVRGGEMEFVFDTKLDYVAALAGVHAPVSAVGLYSTSSYSLPFQTADNSSG
jgi:predicted RNA methylase